MRRVFTYPCPPPQRALLASTIRCISRTTHQQQHALKAATSPTQVAEVKNVKKRAMSPASKSSTGAAEAAAAEVTLQTIRFKNDIQKYRLRRALWEENTSLVTSLSMPAVDDLAHEAQQLEVEDCTVTGDVEAGDTQPDEGSDELKAIDEFLGSFEGDAEDSSSSSSPTPSSSATASSGGPLPLILSAQARVKRFHIATQDERKRLVVGARKSHSSSSPPNGTLLKRMEGQLEPTESPECTTNVLCIPDLGAKCSANTNMGGSNDNNGSVNTHARQQAHEIVEAASSSKTNKTINNEMSSKLSSSPSFFQSLMDAATDEVATSLHSTVESKNDNTTNTTNNNNTMSPLMHVVIYRHSSHEDVMENAAELIHEHYYGLDDNGNPKTADDHNHNNTTTAQKKKKSKNNNTTSSRRNRSSARRKKAKM